jgi:hypothetical protein
MDANGMRCSAQAVCNSNPFRDDDVRSLKIVCSPTNTSLNITQISRYYGNTNRAAGDLIAEWPASAEALQRNAAEITRDGAAFEASVPARLDRMNFQYYATFSGIDAAGASIQSSTNTQYSIRTCESLGLDLGRFFLFWVMFIGVFCVALPIVTVIIITVCDAVGTRHRRLPTNDDNDNDGNDGNA